MPRPAYPNFPAAPTQDRVDALFAVQRAADPNGLRLHLFAAGLAVFLAAFPTSVVEWAPVPLVLCFLVRMWTHHRVIGPLFWDPVTRLAAAFAAWLALSALWSAGGAGRLLNDAQHLRYGLFIPMLYPVLDRSRTLITCLILGVVCAQCSQLAHFIGVTANIASLDFHRDPSRISGWWDPVVAGSLLTAALGLCCGLALPRCTLHAESTSGDRPTPTRGLVRSPIFAFGLIVLILLSILATGTRGAWIAATILIGIAFVLALIRLAARAHRGGSRRPLFGFIAAAALLAAAIVGAWSLSPALRDRVDHGVAEVRAAMTDHDYSSDTGQRIAMAIWAVREFKSHPVRGVGAGGFQPYAAAHAHDPINAGPVLPLPHAHAHSWPLHTLATLGLLGAAILAALLIAALRSAALPVALALLGLTLAGLFDTIHVNQQTAYLLFILLALSVKYRPTEHAPPRPERVRRDFRRPDSAAP